ncbi:ABC transporter ATP-binding protein [Kurthia massiliensis]|uniref:ABC transporter ATP-binding protein n=1 Tax=Kurthia massiliensis TaxID=1033739 RepID=UPI00028854C5|nr:ABC transporter ATP-binding protein [Kurthia massiliensis]
MFDIFKKLDWFFKAQWKRYTIAILLLAFSSVLEIVPPKLIGDTIDAIYRQELTRDLLWQYSFFMVAVMVIGYITNYIWQYQLFGGSNILEYEVRRTLMGKFLHMAPPFYERNRTGDLMARSTNDLNAVSETAGYGIMTMLDSSFYLVTIILMMGFGISWQLTLVAILPLPFLAYAMQLIGKKIHERFVAAQAAFGDMNDRVLEAVEGVRVVRAYVQEREMEAQFNNMTQDVYDKNMQVERVDALFAPISKILTAMSYMLGLGYGAYLVSKGVITIGELVTFNVYLGMVVWPMMAIGEMINVMQRGNASADRVRETLNEGEDVPDPTSPVIQASPEGIVFDGVNFTYPTARTTNLVDIDITLKRGETLGIVGKTGSGKTTIVKQLLREYPLGDGDIAVGDASIASQTKAQVRGWIGYVPQEHILFSRTVRENILFGKDDATEEELQAAIRMANFEEDVKRLPQGLETMVGEKGISLSGGQKQRISIARALIRNPEILILDDSLSAVDAKTESTIIHNIQALRRDQTTIIITHRLSAVMHADRIIVLEDGRMIQQGTHDELVAQRGWYHEQFALQQLGGERDA